MNKKIIIFSSVAITALTFASPVFAASGDVTKIETFIKSVIQVLVTLQDLFLLVSLYGEALDISPVPATQKL
jgi:hypothetical protein